MKTKLTIVLLLTLWFASRLHGQRVYYLPQVANGQLSSGHIQTTFILLNTGARAVSATLSLKRDDGTPLPVRIPELGSGSSFSLVLDPGSTRILRTDGSGPASAGAATVSAGAPIGVSAIFSLFNAAGVLQSEMGVASSEPLTEFSVPVESWANLNTGLALFNTGSGAASVALGLVSAAGQQVMTGRLSLSAQNHTARFVSGELFAGITDFVGSVAVSSTVPLAALAIRQIASPLSFTTLPVVARDVFLASDFLPPTGADLEAPTEAPGRFRILTATSPDGLTFTPTGRIVSDQANVPDLVMDDKQRLYLYYTGGKVGDRKNATAVAISDDFGVTWAYKHLALSGFEYTNAADPDIVRLADGTFRLFVTGDVGANAGIIYADSTDGVRFQKRGVAFSVPGSNAVDSTTFRVGSTWHMFVLDMRAGDQWHAVSADGANFSSLGKISFVAGGAPYIGSNEIALPNGVYRMYGFHIPLANVRSFTSTDAVNWTVEPGVRLAHDSRSAVESAM